jgi:hypothetical protein
VAWQFLRIKDRHTVLTHLGHLCLLDTLALWGDQEQRRLKVVGQEPPKSPEPRQGEVSDSGRYIPPSR